MSVEVKIMNCEFIEQNINELCDQTAIGQKISGTIMVITFGAILAKLGEMYPEVVISEKDIGDFSDALANSETYIAQLEVELNKLAPMLFSDTQVNEQLSLDDIDIFGRLRGITLIKGLTIPAKIRTYIDHFSNVTNIPTYDNIAI